MRTDIHTCRCKEERTDMRWGVLFAGIGGVEWGLEQAGHEVLWAIENDSVAAQFYS